MLIGGFRKFSLSDYPGKSAAIVFTQGCNFTCPWCHNRSLIPLSPAPAARLDAENILGFLAGREGMLDGVVITGGEPTIHDDLPEFARRIKELGFAVKLDTNGSRPGMLRLLAASRLVDYFAMDIKAPLEKYGILTGIEPPARAVAESISVIAGSGIGHEFRTTFVDTLLDLSDLAAIASLVPKGSRHRIQEYRSPRDGSPVFPGAAVPVLLPHADRRVPAAAADIA